MGSKSLRECLWGPKSIYKVSKKERSKTGKERKKRKEKKKCGEESSRSKSEAMWDTCVCGFGCGCGRKSVGGGWLDKNDREKKRLHHDERKKRKRGG